MKSIKTFWSPELKKERALRKDESCKYQLLINDHQKRTKQVRTKISLDLLFFCFITGCTYSIT